MESLALTFSSGWASGVNAYLVVLILGVTERVSPNAQIPDELGRWEILAVAAAMYAFEFVADKVPYVDSVWDVVSTVIRPVVGGSIGVLLTGDAAAVTGVATDAQEPNVVVGGLVGGFAALAAHIVKAGVRLAVNTVPEPVSNILISIAEDVVVLGLVWFAIEHPYLAAGAAAIFLVVGVILLWVSIRVVRAGWRRFRSWRQGRRDRAHGTMPGTLPR